VRIARAAAIGCPRGGKKQAPFRNTEANVLRLQGQIVYARIFANTSRLQDHVFDVWLVQGAR
jgi:hypothetical protein